MAAGPFCSGKQPVLEFVAGFSVDGFADNKRPLKFVWYKGIRLNRKGPNDRRLLVAAVALLDEFVFSETMATQF